MKIGLVYISPNGTTEQITGLLAVHLSAYGEVMQVNLGRPEMHDRNAINPYIWEGFDLIGIGSPVYHMRMLEPISEFCEIVMPFVGHMNRGLKVFLYVTYCGITSGKAMLNTAKQLELAAIPVIAGMKVCAPHFWQKAGYPQAPVEEFAGQFCAHIASRLEEYPSPQAMQQLLSYQKPIVKFIYPFSELIGILREQHIACDAARCVQCGRCEAQCPVGGIVVGAYPERSERKCIYCYHCVTVCMQRVFSANIDNIKEAVARNKKIVGLEEPLNAIY